MNLLGDAVNVKFDINLSTVNETQAVVFSCHDDSMRGDLSKCVVNIRKQTPLASGNIDSINIYIYDPDFSNNETNENYTLISGVDRSRVQVRLNKATLYDDGVYGCGIYRTTPDYESGYSRSNLTVQGEYFTLMFTFHFINFN